MRGLITKLYGYSLSLGRVYLAMGLFVVLSILNKVDTNRI